MKTRTLTARPSSNRYLVAGVAIMTALTIARPDLLARVYAADNQYEWTRQDALDPMGGTYSSAAQSANGSHLILSVTNGGEQGDQTESPLYISSNYGAAWENVAAEIEPGVQNIWADVDVSNNGQVMVAASEWGNDYEESSGDNGKIYVSENGGSTWADRTPGGVTPGTPGTISQWRKVVVSGDGSKIVAISRLNDMTHSDSDIYISEDGGETWGAPIQAELNGFTIYDLNSLSISDNGDKILVGGENSDDYDHDLALSTNNGASWVDISPPADAWMGDWTHDMSADGQTIVVAAIRWNGSDSDTVHVSKDGGDTWTSIDPDPDNFNIWASVAVSDNGAAISLFDRFGTGYISSDAGDTWSTEDPGQEYEDENDWSATDINSDGSKIIAAGEGNTYLLGAAIEEPDPEVAPVVTLSDPEGGKTVTLTTPAGTTITCHSAVKESGLTAKDAAYAYPLGLVDFCFSGAGESNDISLIFVTDLKPNQVVVRKYKPGSNQYSTITNATVTETTYNNQHALLVTYAIVDNGPLDTDPDEGEVADPVGLGVADVTVPNTGFRRAH